MKAIRFHEFGGPEVLKLEDVPDLEAGPGEVLVRVHSSGVNPTDITTRSGRANYPSTFAFPAMLGREAAGTVERLGEGVTERSIGERVLVRGAGFSYAELVVAPESAVYRLPDGLGMTDASTVAITYTTAWDAVVNRANVTEGQTVLVQGAAGGVGVASVQIAKSLGATVIGTAGSDEKLEWAKGQGLDHGINYSTGEYASAVKDLTGGEGVDAVIDGVGGKAFVECFGCLKSGGRVVIYGTAGGREVNFNLASLFRTRASVLGSGGTGTSRGDFERILEMLADGTLHATVDRTWPLAEAGEAQRYVEERRVRGKVALVVAEAI